MKRFGGESSERGEYKSHDRTAFEEKRLEQFAASTRLSRREFQGSEYIYVLLTRFHSIVPSFLALDIDDAHNA